MWNWLIRTYTSYFTHNPGRDGFIYALVLLLVLIYTTVITASSWLRDGECAPIVEEKVYPNPDYDKDDCLDIRYSELLGLTLRECDFGRRMIMASFFGMVIGYERRSPERAAGIRTMSLTSLGSCCFTLCSMFAFTAGPMAWDASRVSAAIPSGVGFLGAGLIWKGSTYDNGSPQVHGLTTAASVWLSAAVGTAAGGGLYFVCAYVVCLLMVILRFAPRSSSVYEEEIEDEEVDDPHIISSSNALSTLENLGYGTTETSALLNTAQHGERESTPRGSISSQSRARRRQRILLSDEVGTSSINTDNINAAKVMTILSVARDDYAKDGVFGIFTIVKLRRGELMYISSQTYPRKGEEHTTGMFDCEDEGETGDRLKKTSYQLHWKQFCVIASSRARMEKQSSLPKEVVDTLIKNCVEAKSRSYSPYSHFPVGCAILGENDVYYTGCNVENVTYGLTVCAERCAFVKMVSEGILKAKAVAISSNLEDCCSPCGMCRQTLAEFADPGVEVLLTRADGTYMCVTVGDLMPLTFTPENLSSGQAKHVAMNDKKISFEIEKTLLPDQAHAVEGVVKM
eukprot:CFRG5222T1